ncbi:MAG: glycosyltransferase [Candidatus Methanoperedens sp.]|nr:glycosyltransferase [Candidatus Methanoperedens sp.]MCZ7370651.1 glycosyltransferase [Candidatus Methanoperedens sp.]
MNIEISIIIPCNDVDALTLECIHECMELDYENFEIIVLPDNGSNSIDDVKIISTGGVSPGRKRNIGLKNSTGEFLAFIDSDAYPRKDWLINAVKYFACPDIAAVGGPGVTPPRDTILQKAGGYVLSSFMVGGLADRYNTGKSRESDDIHSCNFIARRSVLEEIAGWDEKYWPGEDTLICLGIKKLGKKMIESPEVIVFHHRRPLFAKHLAQVSRFGLHRGFFAKKFPETSLRVNYFIPSMFVLFLIFGIAFPLMNNSIFLAYISILFLYLFATFAVSLMATAYGKDLRYLPLVFTGTIATHIAYGVYFIRGLTVGELER